MATTYTKVACSHTNRSESVGDVRLCGNTVMERVLVEGIHICQEVEVSLSISLLFYLTWLFFPLSSWLFFLSYFFSFSRCDNFPLSLLFTIILPYSHNFVAFFFFSFLSISCYSFKYLGCNTLLFSKKKSSWIKKKKIKESLW